MKKVILFYLASILFFSSCNSSVPTDPITSQESMLSFGISNATWHDTKGADITTTNLNSMTVFGYLTSEKWQAIESGNAAVQSSLFYHQMVTRNEGGPWVYFPPKMWDTRAQHHFFAFAPYHAVTQINSESTTSAPSIHYEVPTDAVDQSDLLWGTGNLVNLTYDSHGKSPVDILFRHALTKITFAACMSQEYANTIDHILTDSLKIHLIQIQNIRYSGHSRVVYNSDTTAIEGGLWDTELQSTKLRDFVAREHTPESRGALEQDMWLTTEMQLLNRNDGAFYLMPQALDTYEAGLKPTVYLFFSCKNVNKFLEVEIPLPVPAGGKWAPGQHIRYQLTYNGGGSSPYNIEAVVLPWDNQDVEVVFQEIYLDINSGSTEFRAGSEHPIYYRTKYKGEVNAVVKGEPDLELQVDAGTIILPASMLPGVYTISVTAQNLSRSMQVTIQ